MDAEVVWKYALPMGGWGVLPGVVCHIEMPAASQILTLQVQHGVPTLWAQVNPKSSVVTRVFQWVGTGTEAPSGSRYVGTVQMRGGDFVFHLYEVSR